MAERRVVWTDPDGGEERSGRIMDFDPESKQEVWHVLMDDGGEVEAMDHELEFI